MPTTATPRALTRAAITALALLTAHAPTHATAQPADPLLPPHNGPVITDPGFHRLDNATVHFAPGETVEGLSLVVLEGRIVNILDDRGVTFNLIDGAVQQLAVDVAAGSGALLGHGARAHDLDGMHVYPGFIDPWFQVDTPMRNDADPGAHWSPNIAPQRQVLSGPGITHDHAESLRSLGFVAAALAPDMKSAHAGLMGGLGAVVGLEDTQIHAAATERHAPRTVHARDAFHAMDFNTDGWGGELVYPTSQMGGIALLRQTLADAQWLDRQRDTIPNALSTLTDHTGIPVFFDTDHELELFQAESIFREFEGAPLSSITLIGSGTEFRRLDALDQAFDRGSLDVVLPLRTPRTPDVSTVARADATDLRTLMTWEHAPANPRYLEERGITFSLTSAKLRDRAEFHEHLHAAIEHGLTPDAALAALTTNPARLLGLEDTLGTIGLRRPASFVVASADLFDPAADAEIRAVWINGKRHEINPADDAPFEGDWQLTVGDEADPDFEMTFAVEGNAVTIDHTTPDGEDTTIDARNVVLTRSAITFLIDDVDNSEGGGTYTMSGVLAGTGRIIGTALDPDDATFEWSARRVEADDASPQDEADDPAASDTEDDNSADLPPLPGYPFGPYARAEMPPQSHVVFRGATVWTATDRGIIADGEVEIENGTITYVGRARAVTPDGADVLELDGKHLTPGLIDAHSHTGTWTFGTNEAGQAVTAEVRMGDTNDPDHVSWYRQLASGITTVNTLHGSANPIGGQNVIQKVRWGAVHPRDTHMKDATPGIKFALGENVRQVNWGERYRSRYPQSRMGVDAIMRDRFAAAIDYAAAKDRGEDPRPDLELDAIAEIARNERLIHCHSYRQDEILMLAEIARDFDFTIGSYQHALECYKVAEHVQQELGGAARGSSMFSDWWAFKIEVQDAIPFAGPIEWAVGGNVSFNSDSDELVRRMNTEAAKAVKYAKQIGIDLSEHEALKFVTINPAYQLGIDHLVGSLEVGKDADIAVWSRNPLSTFAVNEHTFVDGRYMFSLDQDRAHRHTIASERARIIQKIIAAADPKQTGETPDDEDAEAPAPESLSFRERLALDRFREHAILKHLEGQTLTTEMTPGDCGCGLSAMGIYR